MTTTIAWLRRDLRLHDHAVLATAMSGDARVQPVFVLDRDVLARFTNKNDRRLSFIAATLCDLHRQLVQKGGGLLVLHGKASAVVPALAKALHAGSVICAEDFEPATIARDAAVKKSLGPIRFVHVLDQLMKHPRDTVKDDGTPYKVFTPWFKRWRASIPEHEMGALEVDDAGRYADITPSRKAAEGAGLQVLDPHRGPGALLDAIGYSYHADDLWPVDDAPARLENFIAARLGEYAVARDFMGKPGTSRLSPYVRHGLVSVRECMRAAHEAGHGSTWISELGWREFYASILYHFPQVVEHEFNENYREIPWRRDKESVEAFTQARTGYPIVDAALRELLQTGWMHNRARMIVASFATKHLLLDWRIGEEFFAQHLMDYDLASNNGGWQWSASTGTDAQPYFRVFNPELQSRKFDASGTYIRHYLPELADVSDKHIHAPWKSKTPPTNYPAPIVDHDAARARAIAAFKKA